MDNERLVTILAGEIADLVEELESERTMRRDERDERSITRKIIASGVIERAFLQVKIEQLTRERDGWRGCAEVLWAESPRSRMHGGAS